MAKESCINCGETEVTYHDITLRGSRHDGVPLCEGCHGAIQQELPNAD